MKRLNVFCLSLGLLLAAGVSDVAQADAEDEMKGFIVDNTISHIGHDFYYYFADRLRATSRLDFNLVVRERPDARWGSLITVEFERDVLYRRFLPPN
jgi:curli production assembly/transport component CsgE